MRFAYDVSGTCEASLDFQIEYALDLQLVVKPLSGVLPTPWRSIMLF